MENGCSQVEDRVNRAVRQEELGGVITYLKINALTGKSTM